MTDSEQLSESEKLMREYLGLLDKGETLVRGFHQAGVHQDDEEAQRLMFLQASFVANMVAYLKLITAVLPWQQALQDADFALPEDPAQPPEG